MPPAPAPASAAASGPATTRPRPGSTSVVPTAAMPASTAPMVPPMPAPTPAPSAALLPSSVSVSAKWVLRVSSDIIRLTSSCRSRGSEIES